uniref:CUB domain-containing protein n=1 Tax=Macrostomum lignano TaxID=282301 RepID=A0A1I8FAV9_9PLAT
QLVASGRRRPPPPRARLFSCQRAAQPEASAVPTLAQQLSQANRSFDSNLQIPIARSRLCYSTPKQHRTVSCASSWLAAFLFNSGVCCRCCWCPRGGLGGAQPGAGKCGQPGQPELRAGSNSENQCDYDYLEANETVASCGDLSFTLWPASPSPAIPWPVSPACATEGFQSRSACIRKYILDLATGKPTPQCKFS